MCGYLNLLAVLIHYSLKDEKWDALEEYDMKLDEPIVVWIHLGHNSDYILISRTLHGI
jgi:hypothetical protein